MSDRFQIQCEKASDGAARAIGLDTQDECCGRRWTSVVDIVEADTFDKALRFLRKRNPKLRGVRAVYAEGAR